MSNNEFNVMDMVDDIDPLDTGNFFKDHPVSGNIKAESPAESPTSSPRPSKKVENETKAEDAPKRRKAWTPDASLTEGMNELNQTAGAVYDAKDVVLQEQTEIVNNADEATYNEGVDVHNQFDLKLRNIIEAKQRRGYIKLQIPPGELQTKFMIAAADPDRAAAQAKLDALFDEIEKTYPAMILERVGDNPATASDTQNYSVNIEDEFPSLEDEEETAATESLEDFDSPIIDIPKKEFPRVEEESVPKGTFDTKVIIDKTDVPDVSWTDEDIKKIKRSRTIELNIVEAKDIEFSNIVEADTNVLDSILEQYERKSNDQSSPLPASKYRATFTGLTYAEVVDLSTSNEMNTLDGERKKWSICYNHIKNQSIGPWETYITYVDPVTKQRVKAPIGSSLPAGVRDKDIHIVSKFEDFLRKTSYLDLEFMIWKILCATALDKETISIDCHHVNNGVMCGHTYEWIYSPEDLLVVDSIEPSILEDMKAAAEASSKEQIMKIYNSSLVSGTYAVTLHTSGFKVIYGHASAYEYLEGVFPNMKDIRDEINDDSNPDKDPELVSKSMKYSLLSIIKSILIPTADGKYSRVTGADNIVRILSTLDEIDWETLLELQKIAVDPYASMRFELKDIVCPKCKSRSSIAIENVSRLLFIVARSLSSVKITLKSN